ncbi:MAG: PHP domain-containing protein [Candidatus Limnocylindria bacterium]
MAIGRVDLHTHSIHSDGVLEPAALVGLAASRGVTVQALSDHDTLSGVSEAVEEGEHRGVRVIPATELNTESEWGDVHILGYFLDPADRVLAERLRRLREDRARRIGAMVERLNEIGSPVSLDRVLEIARGGALGRPHLAQALLEAGHVPSFDAAFQTLIAKDSPAYVPRVGLTPVQAVELVREHGGVSALAHPGTALELERLLPLLVASGLSGIECHYGDHSAAFTARCLALAQRHDLVPTGGSDFHGRGEHGADLGSVDVPAECVAALEGRRAGS